MRPSGRDVVQDEDPVCGRACECETGRAGNIPPEWEGGSPPQLCRSPRWPRSQDASGTL